jgi:uncharacterized protein YjbI with pentapeptide repeats/TolA-binding protein
MEDKATGALDRKEVIAQARTGRLEGASLANIKLAKADLSAGNLRKIQAAGVNFRRAVFRGADLSGANLAGADLQEADFTGADLSGAILTDAKVNQANFTGAKLVGAQAGKAVFDKAVFRNADLADADLSGALLRTCRIEASSLVRARLVDADAAESTVADVDLSGADAREATFRECRFERVKAADLSGPRADFSFAELKTVDFSHAHLPNARFFGAILKNVDFNGATLTETLFKRSQHRAVNFQNADLKNALLKGVYGFREKDLLALQEQGALIDLFLFRRFLRLLWRSLLVKIVVGAALAATVFAAYRFFTNPYNWSYEALRDRAQKLYQKGDYARGEQIDRVIIQKYARDRNHVADARLAIADSYRARRQFDTALTLYQEIAATYEGDREASRALESMAAVYQQTEQTEKARAALERLRETEAGNPDAEANAEFGLAELLKKERRNEEALAKYQAIFEKFRFDPVAGDRALLETIGLLCQFDRLDEAEAALARLENYDASPTGQATRVRGAMLIAELLHRRGDLAEAEKRYRAIFDAYKDFQKSRDAGTRLVEIYQGQGRIEEADAQLVEMLKRATGDDAREDLVLAQARLFAATKRPDKAIALLAAKLPAFKDRGRLFDGELSLLQMQSEKGDLSATEKTYDALVGKFSGDADRLMETKAAMSRIYAAKGQAEKAQALLRDIIAHAARPEQAAAAKLELADQYHHDGARDKAEHLYRELYDARSTDAGAALLAGLALVEDQTAQKKYAEAEAQLAEMETRWPAGNPDHSLILLRRISVLQRAGKYDEAIARLLQLAPQLTEADKRRDANFLLLSLYIAAKNPAGAEQTWARIHAESAAPADAALRADTMMAQFYSALGLHDKAEALYRDVVAKSPDSAIAMQAQLDLAGQCRQAGDVGRAEQIYRDIITQAIDPIVALSAGTTLADLLAEQRSFDEAQQILETLRLKWVADDAHRDDLTVREVRVYQRAGKPEAAAALLERELPNFRDPRRTADAICLLLDIFVAVGDVKRAEDSYQVAAKMLSGRPDQLALAKFQLGRFYASKDLAEKAMATFSEVIAQHAPDEIEARAKTELAALHYRRGELADAEKIDRELADTLRDPVHAFAAAGAVADILADEGKFGEADKQLEAMLKKFGARTDLRAQVFFRRVQFYRRQGRNAEAIATLRQGISLLDDPRKVADANVMLMELCGAQGDIKAAEEAFNQVANTAGDDPGRLRRLKLLLARMYVEHQQPAKGVALYKELYERPPHDEVAAQARLSLAAEFRRRGDLAAAEKLLRELLADKNTGSLTVAAGGVLADMLTESRRLDDADAVLVDLLKRPGVTPNDRADIVLWRARLFQRREKDQAAVALVNEELPRIADAKKKADAYGFLMDIYRRRDDLPTLETLYRAAAKDLAGDVALLSSIKIFFGQVCVSKELFAKALPLFEEVATQNPHNENGLTARLEIAGLQRKMGDSAKAEQTYRELLDEPGSPSASFAAGLLYYDILRDGKRFDEADKLLTTMRAKWTKKGRERDEVVYRQALLSRLMNKPSAQTAAFLEGELKELDDRGHLFDCYLLLLDLYQTAGDARKAEAAYAKIQEVFGAEPERLARAKELFKRP